MQQCYFVTLLHCYSVTITNKHVRFSVRLKYIYYLRYTMEYEQIHLLNWLKKSHLINIRKLEKASDCPKDTIRHFVKERRSLSNEHLQGVYKALAPYGFKALSEE